MKILQRRVRKPVKCVEDAREDEFLDVFAPEKVEVFVVGDFGGGGVGRELFKHDVDVDE